MKKNKPKSSKGRRSKAENMTGAKDAAVEVRKAGELDLQQIVIDDGDFDLHFRAMKSAKERMKTAKNLYDGCAKAAKKVSADLLDAVKQALKLEGMDPADVKRELEVRGYALKRVGCPVQLSVHDTLAGDVNDKAYKRGNYDGANGRTCNSPYPEGTELDEHYRTGYRNAQNAIIQGMAPKDEASARAGSGDEDEAAISPDSAEDDLGDEGEAEGEPTIPAHLDRREPALAH